MNLDRLLRTHHGVVTRAELLRAGFSDYQIRRLVDAGRLERHKRGWLRDPSLPLNNCSRARLWGGAVSCVSALQQSGFWVPERHRNELHVRVARQAPSGGAVFHERRDPIPADGLDSFWQAMLSAQRCLELEELVAVLDAAAMRALPIERFHELPEASRKLQQAAELAGHRADSVLESIGRVRLQQLRIAFRTHVRIGVFEFDVLVGDYLAIEFDGFEYHSSQAALQRDRQKDRFCAMKGITLLRFTYWDVMERWEECSAQILRLVRARRHRYPTSRQLAGA